MVSLVGMSVADLAVTGTYTLSAINRSSTVTCKPKLMPIVSTQLNSTCFGAPPKAMTWCAKVRGSIVDGNGCF